MEKLYTIKCIGGFRDGNAYPRAIGNNEILEGITEREYRRLIQSDPNGFEVLDVVRVVPPPTKSQTAAEKDAEKAKKAAEKKAKKEDKKTSKKRPGLLDGAKDALDALGLGKKPEDDISDAENPEAEEGDKSEEVEGESKAEKPEDESEAEKSEDESEAEKPVEEEGSDGNEG